MDITIVLVASRYHFLDRIAFTIEQMLITNVRHVIVYVDCDVRDIHHFKNAFVRFPIRVSFVFRKNGRPSSSGITVRRKRIAQIHKEIQKLHIDTTYVCILEDDTLPPPSGLHTLFTLHTKYPHAGFVSGVQKGRHGVNHLGVWEVDNVYSTKEIKSMCVINGEHEVDATGLYFMLLRTRVYKSIAIEETFENILGPDVAIGMWLRRNGYTNYIDASVHCKHITEKGDTIVQGECERIIFNKVGETWKMKL